MSPADIRLLIMVLSEVRELVNGFEFQIGRIPTYPTGMPAASIDPFSSLRSFEKQLSKRISELEDLVERMEDAPQSKESN